MKYVIRKNDENSIDAIEITTEDQVISITEEEARKLKAFLNGLFPEKPLFLWPERTEENSFPPMPFPFKTPTYNPPPCIPSPTIVPTEPFPYYPVYCESSK